MFSKNSYSKILKTVQQRGFAQAQAKFVKPNVDLKYTQLFINGRFVDSVSGKTMASVDPRNEQVITHIAAAQPEDIDIAVKAARKAFDEGPWPRVGGFDRSKMLWKLADLIERDSKILQQLETWDNGKPLSQSAIDMNLCIEHLRYYAGWADKIQGKTIPGGSMFGKYFGYTLHEPIGVIGAIIPWNFPLTMFMWKLAPALATGNTIVIKAAESTPLTALYAAHLCTEAGIPEGVVNVVPGLGDVAGAALAAHHGLNKLAFTGETSTGKLIMKAAAEKLIPVTLELGGKSPSIVFDDADIDNAVGAHQIGLFLNAGQCCCASSRIYVQEKVYDQFVEKTVKATKKRKVGDPFTDVDQGPQQNEEQFKKVLNYIAHGEQEGAKLLAGGRRIGKQGYFVESTVFGDVRDDMKISKEEIFGPVMQITKFKDPEEALRRANDSQYGLASAVFTKDLDKANYFSRALKAGTVWINTYDVLDAPQPFGGYKQSGIGREKGEYALSNFTQVKSVIQSLPNTGGWY